MARWLVVLALVAGCSSDGEGERPPSTTAPTSTAPATADPLAIELSPLLGRPSAVAVHEGVVWIADDGRDVVLRLDETNGRELGPPIAVPPGPVALAVDERSLWVSGAGGTLARIDLATGAPGEVVELGGTPSDVLVADGTVWVADLGRSLVVPVDPSSLAPGAPVEVPAGVVRLSASTERLWVTNLEDTVTSVELDTLAVSEPIEVGSGPIGLAVADGVVWVADSDDGTVSRLDEATGEPEGDLVLVGSAPVAVELVGDAVWVIEQDGRAASRIDARTGEVELRSGDLAIRPRGIAAGAGGALWVVGVDPSAAVLVLDA